MNKLGVTLAFFLIFLFIPSVLAVPQITINSPQNITYETNEILIDISQIEASPEMLWYQFRGGDWLSLGKDLNNTRSADEVHAYNLTLLWNYSVTTNLEGSPAFHDGVVYFGDSNTLFAIHENGTQKWNYTDSYGLSIIAESSPAISDGVVYIGNGNNSLLAVNLDGTLKWRFDAGYVAGGMARSSPSVSDGVIYIGSYDYNLYAIYENGTKKWDFSTGYYASLYSSPAVYGDAVYFSSNDDNIYAIYLNGTKKWNYSLSSPYHDVVIDGDAVYVADDDYLTALYLNGSLKWQSQLVSGAANVRTFAISDNIIYACAGTRLYAVYDNGTQKWNLSDIFVGHSKPAISDGIIYIGDAYNKLEAVYINGTLMSSYDTGDDVDSSPSVVGGVVYVGSDNGFFYALGDGSSGNALQRTVSLKDGGYNLVVYSRDASGNINTTDIHFTVSKSTPNITIFSPENTSYLTTSIPLTVSSNKTMSHWWYSLNGGVDTYFSPNSTITAIEGSNHIIVYANDTFGNLDYKEKYFNVSPIFAPQITINSPVSRIYNVSSIPFSITQLEDSPSNMWYELRGESWTRLGFDLANTRKTPNINPQNINPIWSFNTGGDIRQTSASVSNGFVYIGSLSDKLFSLYALNGSERWNFSSGGDIYSTPTISDGVIYFMSSLPMLYALYENGTQKWNYTLTSSVYSSPVVYNGIIYFGCSNRLLALYENGTQKWNLTFGHHVSRYSIPAIYKDVIYVNSLGESKIYAIHINGTIKWNYTAGGYVDMSPLVVNDMIYFTARDKTMYALFDNGTQKWNFTTTESIGLRYSPAYKDGVLYAISSPATLYAIFEENGTEKWNYSISGASNMYSSPAIAGDTIYFGDSFGGRIYAIYINGTEKWNYLTGGQIRGSPSIAGGMVFIGSLDDNLYAFGDNSSTNSLERNYEIADGSYELVIYSEDAFGNSNVSSVSFTVDTASISISILSPQNATYSNLLTQLEVSSNKTVDAWWYSLNNGSNITFTPNTTITAVEGSNYLIVYANDTTFGNIASDYVYFTVTLPPPPPPSGMLSSIPLTLSIIMSAGAIISFLALLAGGALTSVKSIIRALIFLIIAITLAVTLTGISI